jgi:hypothetical protein
MVPTGAAGATSFSHDADMEQERDGISSAYPTYTDLKFRDLIPSMLQGTFDSMEAVWFSYHDAWLAKPQRTPVSMSRDFDCWFW